jgi:hypothetical protein
VGAQENENQTKTTVTRIDTRLPDPAIVRCDVRLLHYPVEIHPEHLHIARRSKNGLQRNGPNHIDSFAHDQLDSVRLGALAR